MDPSTSACILDLSHYQNVSSFHEIASAGIEGVILKCTQGVSVPDPKYRGYKERAAEVGLCVGAYHFLTRVDGAAQADWFLAHCGTGVVAALDWETNDVPVSVAEAFAQRVFSKTGKYPLCYGSVAFLTEHEISDDSILAKCPLWVAAYRSSAPDAPAPWSTWSIWQNTDHRSTPGVGISDGDIFHRPKGNLAAWWKEHVIGGAA